MKMLLKKNEKSQLFPEIWKISGQRTNVINNMNFIAIPRNSSKFMIPLRSFYLDFISTKF